MVSITKKQVGNNTYFYLGHTYRSEGKLKKIEKYLGKEIPKEIEYLKKKFIFEVYKEKWFRIFENIKDARFVPDHFVQIIKDVSHEHQKDERQSANHDGKEQQ